jgi:hypothetical protein
MCHCYVPFRGVIDIFVLALKVRYFASEDGRGTNPFPTTRVRLCLGILSGAYQVGDDWGFEFLFVEA